MKNQNNHHQLKTLLVNPPWFTFSPTPDSRILAYRFSLGLGYIAAVLEQADYPVEIYDADIFCRPIYNSEIAQTPITEKPSDRMNALLNSDHEVWHKVEALFREKVPDIIGVSTRALTMPTSYTVARIAKKVNKEIIVVFGGPGATSLTEEVLQNQNVDFVVRGEGEQTMTELVETLHSATPDFYHIDGLSFKDDGRIINNKNRKIIKDIDTLPYPAKHLMLFADTLPDDLYKGLQGDIISSRGCPFPCTFCAANVAWEVRSVRKRRPQEIVKEILHQKKLFGIDYFILWDDLFTVKRKRVVEICNLLIEKKANLTWRCCVRVDTIDPELLALMKEAGCVELHVGIESGSDRLQKEMKKGITVGQVRKAAKMINDAGIDWTMLLMIGVPGETKEEMAETMDLLNLAPTKVSLSVFDPYPGTALHTQLKAEGRLDDYDLSNMEQYYVNTMPEEEFRDLLYRYGKQAVEYNNRTKYGHTLVKIDPPLTSIIDIKPHLFQMGHWGMEANEGQVLLWLGEGQAEGLTGVFWATESCDVQLSLSVEAGPGRKGKRRRIELILENEAGFTEKSWQFYWKANLKFKTTLQPGRNKFSIQCTDKATVPEQLNGDTRPLLVLLSQITVQPADQPNRAFFLTEWMKKFPPVQLKNLFRPSIR